MKNRHLLAFTAAVLLVLPLILSGCGKGNTTDDPAKDDKTPAAKEQRDRKKGD